MILYYAPTSPFTRKVMIVAHETGQAADITLRGVVPAPVALEPTLVQDNPLSKIPLLITDDGLRLHDSAVIVDWLCRRAGDTTLLPAEGAARWQALALQSLGDGICDAALLMRFETALRPADKYWPEWFQGQAAKITSALAHLEARVDSLGWTAGEIAVLCALGYLDLRLPDFDWRNGAPRLADWYAAQGSRASAAATAPN